jgi:hypothetical protein
MIVATRAAQQPGLLVRKHSARAEDLDWNEGLSKQHDKKTRYKQIRQTDEQSQVQYFKKIGMILKSYML